MATWRERSRKASRSGFVEALREDRAVKHESGYRVTLQMVLIDSTKLEDKEEAEAESVGSLSLMGCSNKAARVKPMTKVKKRTAEMVMAAEADLGRGFWLSRWLSLP